MHESRANHVVGEEVGVGVPADPVIDDGLPQALQPVGEVVWRAQRQVSPTIIQIPEYAIFTLYNMKML